MLTKSVASAKFQIDQLNTVGGAKHTRKSPHTLSSTKTKPENVWAESNANTKITDHVGLNIEDIYSFAVNTIYIVIECNENISLWKIWMFSLHEMKFFMAVTEKE